MNMQKIINGKFSIILTVAMILLALSQFTTAQKKSEVFPADANISKNGDEVLRLCRNGGFQGGIYVAAGDLSFNAMTRNSVYVSKISLLSGNFDNEVGVVDSCDPNALSKIKNLLGVRKRLGLTNDVVFSIPQQSTPEWFQVINFLRQAHTDRTIIPAMGLLVSDSRNPQYVEIKMENVLISSYLTGERTDPDVIPMDTMSLNFSRIDF